LTLLSSNRYGLDSFSHELATTPPPPHPSQTETKTLSLFLYFSKESNGDNKSSSSSAQQSPPPVIRQDIVNKRPMLATQVVQCSEVTIDVVEGHQYSQYFVGVRAVGVYLYHHEESREA